MFKYSFIKVENFWSKLSETLNDAQHYHYEIENFHKTEEDSITSHLKNKNSNILELSCGTGRLLKLLNGNDFNKIYGIDISQKMIKICRKSLPSSIVLLQHDFRTRLPFESNFFDFILFVGNTLANVDRLDLVFKEVNRVLKNDGKLIIGCFNAECMTDEIVKSYYGKLPETHKLKRFDKKSKTVYIGSLFAHWVTESELKKLIEKAGFKLVSIQKKGIGLIGIAKKL